MNKPTDNFIAHPTHVGLEMAEYLSEKYAEFTQTNMFYEDEALLNETTLLSLMQECLDDHVVTRLIDSDSGVGFLLGYLECYKELKFNQITTSDVT